MTTTIQIHHIDTKTARKNFKVSLSTLRRATELLKETLPIDAFDKEDNERGYTLKSYLALEKYFDLRRSGMPTHRAAEYLRWEFMKKTGV